MDCLYEVYYECRGDGEKRHFPMSFPMYVTMHITMRITTFQCAHREEARRDACPAAAAAVHGEGVEWVVDP